MSDLLTRRLALHPVDVAEGERIVAQTPDRSDKWAADYPFEGDLVAVGAFLRATAAGGEQRPFGYYRITRAADGEAIGGIGFIGQPEDGSVEVGYGLAPSARGHGYAAEALGALLALAAEHGLTGVVATTDPDNVASQRTLLRAGFELAGTDDTLLRYRVVLGPEPLV